MELATHGIDHIGHIEQAKVARDERFDYTEWRRTNLPEFEDIDDFIEKALAYSESLDAKG